jgi:acylpyruvate hydrolase
MKLLRYSLRHEPGTLSRLGVLIGHERVADLRAAYARYLVEEAGHPKGRELAALYLPAYFAQFVHMGEAGWLALADAYTYVERLARAEPEATGLGGERIFVALAECRLYAPVRPPKLIAVERGEPGRAAPTGFMKTLSSLVGHGRDIVKPASVRALDCETKLAVVIGRRCKHVREEDAYGVIAGYTIVNDVTARDLAGPQAGPGLLLGKTFDTFCPMGPWLVTREAIPDPTNLRMRTRVNGELLREGSTRDLAHPIPRLVAHFSQITLMPGDVIAAGAALERARADRFVRAGDVVEAEIEGIGVLRNAVVDEPKAG